MVKDKPYLLGMYEKAMPKDLSMHDKLKACKESGFDFMEISIDETDEKIKRLYWSDSEKNKLIDSIKETGTPIYTMCFSAQRKYSLGSLTKEKHDKAMEIALKAIEFASYIGIRIIQLAGYDCYYEESNMQTRNAFIDNLKKIVNMAAKKGILLGFETMMDRPFIDTVAKGMEYVRMCNSPYLGMYPDIGNLHGAKHDFGYDTSVIDDLKTGSGHLLACHLKETAPFKDRSVMWGEGLTEYIEDLKVLKALNVRMFNGEFWCDYPSDWQNWLKKSNEFLRGKLDQVFNEDI